MTSSRLRKLPNIARPHSLDVAGALLLVCASSPLLLALSWGGVHYSWTSPRILGLLAASVVFGALFAWRTRTAEEPLIPASVLGDQVVKTATVAAGLCMGIFIGLSIVMPVYLEGVVGLTASMSGVALIPLMIGTVAGATIAGRSLSRVDNYKLIPLAGLALALVATGALALHPRGMPIVVLEILFLCITLGLGTVLPTATVAIQNAVPRSELGSATAVSNFFRQIGGALVAAIFGAMVFGAGVDLEGFGAGGKTLDAQSVATLVEAFRNVYVGGCIMIVIAAAFFATMQLRPLRSDSPTNEDHA